MTAREINGSVARIGAGTLRAGTPLLLWLILQQLTLLTQRMDTLIMTLAQHAR